MISNIVAKKFVKKLIKLWKSEKRLHCIYINGNLCLHFNPLIRAGPRPFTLKKSTGDKGKKGNEKLNENYGPTMAGE